MAVNMNPEPTKILLFWLTEQTSRTAKVEQPKWTDKVNSQSEQPSWTAKLNSQSEQPSCNSPVEQPKWTDKLNSQTEQTNKKQKLQQFDVPNSDGSLTIHRYSLPK